MDVFAYFFLSEAAAFQFNVNSIIKLVLHIWYCVGFLGLL